MNAHARGNNEHRATTKTDSGSDNNKDVVSDPAFDDSVGSDWAGEGGATPIGPATSTEGADEDDDPGEDSKD